VRITYVYTSIYVYIKIYIHINIHIYINIPTYTVRHTPNPLLSFLLSPLYFTLHLPHFCITPSLHFSASRAVQTLQRTPPGRTGRAAGTHIHMHTYMYIYIHTYLLTYTHTHTHTHTYTHIHTYMHTYIHTYIHKISSLHPYRDGGGLRSNRPTSIKSGLEVRTEMSGVYDPKSHW
jgi:hypothetical protein